MRQGEASRGVGWVDWDGVDDSIWRDGDRKHASRRDVASAERGRFKAQGHDAGYGACLNVMGCMRYAIDMNI